MSQDSWWTRALSSTFGFKRQGPSEIPSRLIDPTVGDLVVKLSEYSYDMPVRVGGGILDASDPNVVHIFVVNKKLYLWQRNQLK